MPMFKPNGSWWVPATVFVIGVALLLSATLERSAAVVASFLFFFFPWL